MSSIKSDDKKYSLYLASQFIVVATILYAFLPPLASNNIVAISYSLLVVGSQSALFCVIAFLLSLIISKTLKKIFFIVKGSPVNSTPFIIWLIFSLLALLLLADLKLYLLYGYHINGFVINLALTKGGIESLGSSNSTLFTFLFEFQYISFFIEHFGLYWFY